MAEPVGAVGGDLEFEEGFFWEQFGDGGAGDRLGWQDEKALGVLGEFQFLGAAHHAFAFDAAEFAGFDFEIAGEDGAGEGEGDFVADFVVFRAADDLARVGGAVVDLANAEAVGVRVLFGGEDFGDDDFVDVSALLVDAGDFEAGAAEEGFEVAGRERAVDEVLEPVE